MSREKQGTRRRRKGTDSKKSSQFRSYLRAIGLAMTITVLACMYLYPIVIRSLKRPNQTMNGNHHSSWSDISTSLPLSQSVNEQSKPANIGSRIKGHGTNKTKENIPQQTALLIEPEDQHIPSEMSYGEHAYNHGRQIGHEKLLTREKAETLQKPQSNLNYDSALKQRTGRSFDEIAAGLLESNALAGQIEPLPDISKSEERGTRRARKNRMRNSKFHGSLPPGESANASNFGIATSIRARNAVQSGGKVKGTSRSPNEAKLKPVVITAKNIADGASMSHFSSSVPKDNRGKRKSRKKKLGRRKSVRSHFASPNTAHIYFSSNGDKNEDIYHNPMLSNEPMVKKRRWRKKSHYSS